MQSIEAFASMRIHDWPATTVLGLARAAILGVAIGLVSRGAHGADQTLQLEVTINGYSTDKVAEFVLRDGVLLSRREELHDLGLRVPDGLASGSDGLISLSDLLQVKWRIEPQTQTLIVIATDAQLLPTILGVEDRAPTGGKVESGTGVTADYDIVGNSVAGHDSGTGLLDLRAFSSHGVLSTGLLAYAGHGLGSHNAAPVLRLDTTYTLSDPDSMRRYRVGDFINGGLAWTRPVRLLGAQFSRDFSLRPDLVTFPLPSVSGSVAVPSTLDVLVNGTNLLSRKVDAGPFEIPQLPVVTGAGTIAMTLTNALGRQVLVTLPFYASSALLAPGLQTLSAQVGAVRRNFGLRSNDYGELAATAAYRRGLSSSVTVEGTTELTAGTVMMGGGVVVNLANFAVLNVAAAGSGGSGGNATQLSAGVQRLGRVFSYGASAAIAGRAFRDIAAANGDAVPRLQLNANFGLSLARFGSVGLAYASIRRDRASTAVEPLNGVADLLPILDPLASQTSRVLSASYSFQVHKFSVYVTGFRDFTRGGSNGVLAGITLPLGRRSSAGASVGSGSGGRTEQVQAQQSAVTIGDWGYQAYGTRSEGAHEFGQVQYRAPWALLTAGVDRTAGATSLAVESQGALSYVDGGLFSSNTIPDSFAVVDTNGLAGVKVLYENRDAGVTDSAGRRLVPDLRAFQVNHLAIEATDIPQDSTIDVTTRDVRPQDRSGVVVRFAVKTSHGALLRLVDEAGSAIPVGSTATLRATGAIVPIGYDGEAYVEDLGAHNDVVVERQDGRRCSVDFDYVPVPGEIPTIGPLPCPGEKP